MGITASRRMRSAGETVRRKSALMPISAHSADYPAVERLLTSVFAASHGSECSAAEFKASIDDPSYEPHDRLITRDGLQLIAHVLTTRRIMRLGATSVPAAGLYWLGVDPAFRSSGHGNRMLAAAENLMADQGGLVGLIETRIPYFFRRTGWALCGHHSRSAAGVHEIIAKMLALGFRPGRRRSRRPRSCLDMIQKHDARRIRVRCWRRVEIPALMRIYDKNTQNMFGPFERSEAYWRWLIERRGYDRLYVALDGPDLFELDEQRTHIVGYAAIRGNQILELMADSGYEFEFGKEGNSNKRPAAIELLARVCDDAIEQGHNNVVYHGHPQDSLHALFSSAGGQHNTDIRDEEGRMFMARLLQPGRVLNLLEPLLQARLRDNCNIISDSGTMPGRLSIDVEGKRYAILMGRKGVAVQTGRPAKYQSASHVSLNVADFTRLVLGQFDWESPPEENSLNFSTPTAAQLLRILFPKLTFWRPPLDCTTAR